MKSILPDKYLFIFEKKLSLQTVSGFIFVINLFDLGGTDKLIKNGYKIVNLIEFPGP